MYRVFNITLSIWPSPKHLDCGWDILLQSHIVYMKSVCCVCCGDLHNLPLLNLQRWWSLFTLDCTRAPWGIGLVVYNKETTNSKVLALLIDYTIEISHPNTVSSENDFAGWIVIAKYFSFSWMHHGSHFMAGCCYWFCLAKDNHNSLWSDQKGREKPLSKQSEGHPCWSTTVVHRVCRE